MGAVVALMLTGGGGAAALAVPSSESRGETVAEPNWPNGECVLSDPHLVFDDENTANPKASISWEASRATPLDPANANFHLRSTTVGIKNLSAHTYFDTTYFASWFYLYEEATTKYNYAPWDSQMDLFDTEVPPEYPWPGAWVPRDPGTPGAQATLVSGVVAGAPLQPVIVSPAQLGKDLGEDGTRPGYELPDIAPSIDQSFTQTMRVERPTNNNAAYASTQYRVVSVATCLPVPTITQPTVGDIELHGTGTTVGDMIKVTDQDGNILGTAVVESDLTWSLTLGSPLDVAITGLTATAVDEFSFEGSADTTVAPLPVAPSVTDPVSVDLSCSGDAVFTTRVTAGVPAPTVVWEQSYNGSTWEPAEGASSPDGLTLTVSANPDHDGMQFRAVASSAAGSAVSSPATLTVSGCLTIVKPVAPRVVDPSECGIEQTFETTPVAGVTYTRERTGKIVRFTASADEGYVLASESTSKWEFEIAEVVECPDRNSDTLAHTGGDGLAALTTVGVVLITASGLLFFRRRSI